MIPRDALGLGLRRPHVDALADGVPEVGFLEVIAENLLEPGSLPRARLDRLPPRYPIVGHGVGLDLLGADPLDEAHLAALAELVRTYRMPWFTEHLCWSASGGHVHHDLLPAPYHPDLVPYVAARVRHVREALGVPIGLENLSSYVRWTRDQLPEWVFLRQVVEAADAHLLVDVNNIWVSSVNHGFDPHTYVDALPWERVLHVHIAGHRVRPDGLRHDTHDRPVAPEVWALYRYAWRRGGPFPTLLEWDDDIPPLETLLGELRTAARVRG